MKAHVELLGWIDVIAGVLLALAALFVFVVLIALEPVTGDQQAAAILRIVATMTAAFVLVFAVPTLAAGIGLLKFKRWARVLALIMGVLALFSFPIGTIIAIYAFWVLTNDESRKLLHMDA